MRDFLSAEIFDISFYQEKSKTSYSGKIAYSALSFRINSEKVRFIHNGKNIEAKNNTVCYTLQSLSFQEKKWCFHHFYKLIIFLSFEDFISAITILTDSLTDSGLLILQSSPLFTMSIKALSSFINSFPVGRVG